MLRRRAAEAAEHILSPPVVGRERVRQSCHGNEAGNDYERSDSSTPAQEPPRQTVTAGAWCTACRATTSEWCRWGARDTHW
jgi:hypothetical protein